MKQLRELILEYFKTIGNPDDPSETYWTEPPNLGQVVIGVLFAPLVLIIWGLYLVFTIKIGL